MRRVRVWADTHSTGLIDELGASIPRRATTVSESTWHTLQQWVADYDQIIPLGDEARTALHREIDELDARGLRLLELLRQEWPHDSATREPIDFTYFSEGRLIPLS